ncbi:MAG: hypothetical protein FVQ77_09585 [Cytophagales bacterium]|nr:hypothetical protein [Cytophagales bacterium]
MKKTDYSKGLEGIKQYLQSDKNEDAKRDLIFPLFRKLFGDKFHKESDAEGADTYIEGQLLIELKSHQHQWLDGFYQGLHYLKKGLSFRTLCVMTKDFLAFWKVNDIPEIAKKLSGEADAQKASSEIGKTNANKTNKAQKSAILKSNVFRIYLKEYEDDLFADEKSITYDLFEFLNVLKNLDSERIQINRHNFINAIEYLKKFFDDPLDAVHCFYSIVGFWDITSTVTENEKGELRVVGNKGTRDSESITIHPKHREEFRKYILNHYIFTKEGSGLRVDYYFSRFDEVIAQLKPEYARQHGIVFTDHNLSKFALWFVHEYYEKKLHDKYVVFDPAGGSGNLVTSWSKKWGGHLKHKIISELQPDLLKTIERRMKLDPEQMQTGFTVIPKTVDNQGLNFLDKSAEAYIGELEKVLNEKNLKIDRPLAFLLNPPYKNTDENVRVREETEANYDIDPSILELTGSDAGKERYLAFLGQIVNIAEYQHERNPEFNPVLMIFTPTSWIIPRPTFVNFREKFDKHFKFENGFIITGNEFFKISGKWPLSFTIWTYNHNEKGNRNNIKLRDFTYFKHKDLEINWDADLKYINKIIKRSIKSAKTINFSGSRQTIKKWCGQKMYDFKRSPTKTELQSNQIYGGLPLRDIRRKHKKTYGITKSEFIGFMEDCVPVRIRPRPDKIFTTNYNKSIWFLLQMEFKNVNSSKIHNAPTDQKAYCAYDLQSAQKTFAWFAISKAVLGRYPLWSNQYDIWKPRIKKEMEKYFYSLCFAYGLAENRCVVAKFEKDNPVKGTPEVFIDNPLSPNNHESFWFTTLEPYLIKRPAKAFHLVEAVKLLYQKWFEDYCGWETLEYVGLDEEPYFKYFHYPDFVNRNSGLIQIKKYAEINGKSDLMEMFENISEKTKEVKEEIYRILVEEFNYFD